MASWQRSAVPRRDHPPSTAPRPAPLPAITPAALAYTRLRVPPPLLCNPHHDLIAQCNDCTLQSLQTAITTHSYTHPTPSLSFTPHPTPPAPPTHAGCPSFPSYPPVNQPPPTAGERPPAPTSCAPPSPARSPPDLTLPLFLPAAIQQLPWAHTGSPEPLSILKNATPHLGEAQGSVIHFGRREG